MKQYTFVLDDYNEYMEAFQSVRRIIDNNPGNRFLMQVIEPRGNSDGFKERLNQAYNYFSEVTIYGMTSQGTIMDDPSIKKVPICSLLSFDSSNYYAKAYDCSVYSTYEAGEQFVDAISDKDNLKGVLVMSADIRLYSDDFIQCINRKFPDVPIFGSMAGSEDVAKDYSLIFMDTEILHRGILAIALFGDDLHIETKNNLGWRPLGREFTITKSSDDGLVHEIDNKPAVDIYREYLGIEPDSHFYENTAAFPFLFKKGGKFVGRVAVDHIGDSIWFTIPIPEGTKASLAYARRKYLLGESLDNANSLIDFCPEALLIYACITRRNFMGDSMDEKEFSYYRNVCPDCSWAGGYGELLYSEDGAGLLNGTLVAVAFREGEKKPSYNAQPLPKEEIEYKDEPLPLIERMVNLLEKTTDELRDNVDQLSYFANHDALTGLYNRAFFDYQFEKILSEFPAENGVALLMIDIDFFKKINDNYGHDAGDEILVKVVSCINASLPKNACFCRWGGEEFMCIVENISMDEVKALAEELRKNVENNKNGSLPSVTISIGATLITKSDMREKNEIISLVDKALYKAKETGRNKVVFTEAAI